MAQKLHWPVPGSASATGTTATSANGASASPARRRTRQAVSCLPPVLVGSFQPMVMLPPSASSPPSTTSGGEGGKLGTGLPYVSYSFFSLTAAAWMGMPVQWKANGKSAFLPWRRWKATANSALLSEKPCPMCSRPFMYGYGNVTRYLPPSHAPSGASTSNALVFAHLACAFSSSRCSESRRWVGRAAGASVAAVAMVLMSARGCAGTWSAILARADEGVEP